MSRHRELGASQSLVVLLILIIIALVIALAMCRCDGSRGGSGDEQDGGEPGEGTFGRFRLLNGQRKKRLTNLELYRKVSTGWDRVDDDLKRDDDSSITCQNIDAGKYFTANVGIGGNLLGAVQGLRVRWQTEHSATKWHEVTWTEMHPAFAGSSGKTIVYVLIDLDPGRRGAGTVSLLMGTGKMLLQAPSEGLGRVEIVNRTGTALDLFEIESTFGGSTVAVHDFLANDGHAEAASLAGNSFFTGSIAAHRHNAADVLAFHEPTALTVRWRLTGGTTKTATFPASVAPFNGTPSSGDHAVQRIRVEITGATGSGKVTLLMANTREAVPKNVP